jgi:hypothetical protein
MSRRARRGEFHHKDTEDAKLRGAVDLLGGLSAFECVSQFGLFVMVT